MGDDAFDIFEKNELWHTFSDSFGNVWEQMSRSSVALLAPATENGWQGKPPERISLDFFEAEAELDEVKIRWADGPL